MILIIIAFITMLISAVMTILVVRAAWKLIKEHYDL